MLKFVKAINLPREICHWLIGDHHHVGHRMLVGSAIMAAGVLWAGMAEGTPRLVHVFLEMTGWAIHAIGASPFVEWLMEH